MTAITFQDAPAGLDLLTREADFQTQVVAALRYLGWVVIEVRNMQGNTTGIPDLMCFRGGQGQMIELKIKGNYLSAGQKRWRERWLPEGTLVPTIYNSPEDWSRLMRMMQ